MSNVSKRLVPAGGQTSAEGLSTVEKGKQLASYLAVDENIKDKMVVGVGSGSTVVYVAERLGQRVRQEKLDLICIPTSFQSRELILKNGLVLGDLSRNFKLDVAIDGADEISPSLSCIKGGGGCHVQEKVVACAAAKFVIVADERKISPALGTQWTKGVPLEVVPIALEPVMHKLRELGGNPQIRTSSAKAGPAISGLMDNGNILVDVTFGVISDDRASELAVESRSYLVQSMKQVTGIVDTGLFMHMASKAYVGMSDGSVQIFERSE